MILNSPSRIHSLLDPARFMRYGTGPGGASATAWSPLDLSPMIWLDATQLGLSNNDPVSSFTDLSGNGRHFVQATGSKQPLFKTSGINGIASVESDGGDDDMTLAAFGTQTAWWGFIVLRQTAVDTGENTFWSISDYPSSGNYKMVEKSAGTDGVAGMQINAVPGGSAFGALGFSANTNYAFYVSADASVMGLKDGAGNTGSTPAGNHSRANDMMRIFGRGDGNRAPAMIGELVFGSGALSAGDVTEMWTYLDSKWGTGIP